jgi:energy-coupling factor transport system ATP-binding protein
MKINVEDISFQYPAGVQALQQVRFNIEPGETVAILGENGAGKTTLAKHLNGLLQPSHGRVLIGEQDTRKHTVAQLARHVGFVFQNADDQLFARTVRAEVAFGPRNLGLSGEALAERVGSALAQVELEEQADRHPYDLHPSIRKRVAIAATLAMEPSIVIFDEPTTGQDRPGIELVGQVVDGLIAAGRTVITISHDVDFCAEHFDRIIVMSAGQILADGSAEDIFIQDRLLEKAGVEAPQMVRLAKAISLPSTPRDVENFVDAWLKWKGWMEGLDDLGAG